MENETPVYGIVGYPAAHSLSPFMHRAAFSRLGIRAEYRIFELRPEQLAVFLKDDAHSLRGFNVTIPFKEHVLPLLDYVTPDARHIGAVNTVKVKSGRLEGFNTDGQGFLDDLGENSFVTAGKRTAVIGAGGASRAVCYSLAQAGAAELAVFNRDSRKASSLISCLSEQFPKTSFRQAESIEKLDIPEADLLVNATSVGMKADDPALVEPRLLRKELFVYDLVYAPPETKLLRMAKEKGCRYANGLGML
ncbi:MAG: shikimate dehydrogenase, partial [Deltaproteobacteria bacterium]